MFKSLVFLIKIAVLLLLGVFIIPADALAEEAQELEHVFIISVDGLNYEGLISTPTVNIDNLASEGVIDEKSMALRSGTMEAAEASLLTGTLPEEHKHIIQNDKLEVESLLEALKKNKKSFLVVDGSGGKLQSFAYGEKEYLQLDAGESDKEVFEQTIEHFDKFQPFFSYIYVNDCWEALLSLDEKAYYEAIQSFDEQLGTLVNKLRQEKLFYKSLIILTSPRSSSPSHMVPLIMHGPFCKSGTQLSASVLIDIVPTVCILCGFKNLYSSRGIPLYDAFLLSAEEQDYLSKEWIAKLKKDRIDNWNRYFALQDEMDRTLRQMASIEEEKDSVFDFAGKKEQDINRLKLQISLERLIYLGIFILMLLAYPLQYRFLKKKFLLFK